MESDEFDSVNTNPEKKLTQFERRLEKCENTMNHLKEQMLLVSLNWNCLMDHMEKQNVKHLNSDKEELFQRQQMHWVQLQQKKVLDKLKNFKNDQIQSKQLVHQKHLSYSKTDPEISIISPKNTTTTKTITINPIINTKVPVKEYSTSTQEQISTAPSDPNLQLKTVSSNETTTIEHKNETNTLTANPNENIPIHDESMVSKEPQQHYKKGEFLSEELLHKAFEKLLNPPQSDDETLPNDPNIKQHKKATSLFSSKNSSEEVITFEGFCYGLEKLWIQWDIDECKIMFNKLALVKTKRQSNPSNYHGTNEEILKLKIKAITFPEFKEALLYWPEVFGHNEDDVKDFENLINRLIATMTPHVKIFGKSYLRCVEDFSDAENDVQENDENSQNKEINSIENANSTIKRTVSSLTINEDEIFEELKDFKNNQWQSRIKALKQLGKLFATVEGGIDSNAFESKFQRFQELLANHVKDRRTVVCKEGCKQLIAIIKYRKKDFYPFVAYFIERCLEIIRSSIQVMSQSGDECVTTMMTSIPEDPNTHLLLRALVTPLNESNRKYSKSREHIIKYVRLIMTQAHNHMLMNSNEYVDELCKVIAQGCEDADATVRNQSFGALKTLQLQVNATKAQRIVDHLTPGALRKYKAIINENNKPLSSSSSSQQSNGINKNNKTTIESKTSKKEQRTSMREMIEQMKKKKQANNQND